jgi:CzcA family heavy metal efflux pump
VNGADRPLIEALSKVHRYVVTRSMRFRHIVLAVAVGMMVYGVVSIPQAPMDVFPNFAPPQIEVQTESLGLSTSDVESLVTVPMELGLAGIPGLVDMRSTSVPQLSSIRLIFAPGTDLLHARQLVQERLTLVRTTLPTWAAPPVMLPPVSATARALQIGMSSDTLSMLDLTKLAYWKVRGRLLQIDGVADVSIWNERQPTFQVQVDPQKLLAHNVTLDSVERTTADALDSGTLQFSTGAVVGKGGIIDSPNQRLKIQHKLSIQTTTDLANTPLEDQPDAGSTLRIRDIGDVVIEHQPLIGDAVIDGKTGILFVVEKLPWGNTLSVTRDAEAAIRELQPGMPGVKFDTTIFRPANFIDDSIRNLSTSLILGFVLVMIILVLFLFEWRVALISLVAMPLSLMAALLVVYLSGATINTMILAGLSIALGRVVDDAVIDVENILRRLRQARVAGDDRPLGSIVLDASREIRNAIIFSASIDVAAMIPIFLLGGLTAAFFRPLAMTYALAIVASMLVALTVTPAMTLLLLRNASVEKHYSPMAEWLRRGYTGLLSRIVARPVVVYATFGVVLLSGLLLVPQLGESLFPTFKQRDLLIGWGAIPGTSDAEVVRTTTKVSKELMAIPGVRNYGAHIGRALSGEEVVGVNFAEAWISIDPSADYDTTIEAVRGVIEKYPGLYMEVLTYLNERIEEVLTGSSEAITVRVYGEDLASTRQKASEILEIVSEVEGTEDLNMDLSVNMPQIRVEVDLKKAGRYGLTPGDVRRAAAAMIAGLDVGGVIHKTEDFTVVVWSKPSARNNPSSISNVMVDTPSGGRVRIGDVARVTMQSDPYLLKRQNGSRYVDVITNVKGRDLGSVVKDIEERLEGVEFPRGSHYEVLGEYAERQAAMNRLLVTALFAAFAILLLLQTVFGSWRLAFLLLLTLPMALVGGVFGIWLVGGVVSIGALVGLFTVFGLAQGNGILLITHCQHLEEQEGMTFGPELVLRGARERLAPILMTSLAIGLGLAPLVYFGDIPGHEIEYPLAVVIIGGLFTSTLLTLFVLPSLYLRFGKTVRPPSSGETSTQA